MSATRHPVPSIQRLREHGRDAATPPARDHATRVIDLHCHLLPGIDDGPRDMTTAIAMARLHVAAGVRTVAATPHVSWDMPTPLATIEIGLAELREALSQERIPLEVLPGAEIDVHQAEALSDDALRALALGGSGWLLLEAPLQQRVELEPVARALLRRGHRIVLAHPERSPLLQRDPAALRRLTREGVLTQLTASSFVGGFGRTVQRYAEQLLEDGLVHTVASDAHDLVRRPPGIADVLVGAGIGDLVPLLSQEVPAAILAGDRIPQVPRRPRRRRPPARRSLRALLGRP
jgi:protein-tyrosine phosphatase